MSYDDNTVIADEFLIEWCREEHGEDLNAYGRWIVCPDCRGRGAMTLKRIAIPAEEFHDDPDFFDDYRNGVYDEPCDQCGGRTTVWAADLSALDPQIREDVWRYLDEMASLARMEAQERAMGA